MPRGGGMFSGTSMLAHRGDTVETAARSQISAGEADRGAAAHDDLVFEEPLDNRERKEGEVEREREGKPVAELRVKADSGYGVPDGLFEVGWLAVLRTCAWQLREPAAVVQKRKEGGGEHSAAA